MATIILAGGSSSRMGREKASLAVGESTALQSLVNRFAGKIGPVVVVLRPDQEIAVEGAIAARDIHHGVGPLGGLHAGLLASPDEENFVLACDMPFADPELARYITSLLANCDAVVPMLEPGPEPLHAAYRKICLAEIERSIAAGKLKMRDALDRLQVHYLPEQEIRERDPALRSFVNVNTPEDYERALRLMRPQ
jgi:molybdopterin-guanine dinucleotide biosynthesis protein A